MIVVIKKPNELPSIVDIEGNDLKTLQGIVGGYIEIVRIIDTSIIMICNEEGKLDGLPFNFILGNDAIVGTVIFVSDSQDGDFTGLNVDESASIIEFLS